MRLSDVLSKAPDNSKFQVEGFLGARKIAWGRHKKVTVGKIALNYFCINCDDSRTFMSGDELSCLIIGEKALSIDASLKCPICNSMAEAWFLVGCEGNLFTPAPVVYLERYVKNRRNSAGQEGPDAEQFEDLLERAQSAYELQLGAGAMVYLRKIFEAVTWQVATIASISTTRTNGKKRPFRELLEEVDQQRHIIPSKFSSNGYQLFSELSDVIHGDADETEALGKFLPCRQLIVGIVDNVRRDEEMALAIDALGWDHDDISTIAGMDS